jgi:hypothetical protein
MKKPREPKVKVHYGQRYEVSAWYPSGAMIEVAHERTEGLVGYFLSCCSRFNPVIWQDQLYTLARSCYLQGAMDAALVAAEENVDEVHK